MDRADVLARIADAFMRTGRLPFLPDIDPEALGLSAETWPSHPGQPREVRFSADWPGITLACSRSLDGYSLEGGLHRAT